MGAVATAPVSVSMQAGTPMKSPRVRLVMP
jgi:hypothetical protein